MEVTAHWGCPWESGPEQVSAEDYLHGLIRVQDEWDTNMVAAVLSMGHSILIKCHSMSFDVVAAVLMHDGTFWHIAIAHSGK